MLALPNFFAQAQNSFAARMKWSITPKFAEANHEPTVNIQAPLKIMVNSGQKVKLNAIVSDIDGDKVSLKWRQIPIGNINDLVEIINYKKP